MNVGMPPTTRPPPFSTRFVIQRYLIAMNPAGNSKSRTVAVDILGGSSR